MKRLTLSSVLATLLVTGCATTVYKPFEGKANPFEGQGGTKIVVDGMELWDNGEPPRKFMVLGIIDDQRPGGIISMTLLENDIVKKAREVGGDALIQLGNQSHITGFYTSPGSSTSMALRRNRAKFAVIKFVE
jgi:hypothetical protein